MRTWSAESSLSPDAAWALLARPAEWPAWSPHVRGAWGLGSPEVRAGAHGAVRLFGVIPVPARITAKEARSWTWQVGLVQMTHRVLERPGGCRVEIDLHAPLESAVAAVYGPVIQLSLDRLARTG